jgi:PleD family two-component response regulator
MELFRRTLAEGYRNASAISRESALDELRSRPDFRLLILDLAFPAEPLAR